MAKITYTDKVKIKDIPVAEVNKFTADNANEIKTIVNELDDIKDNIANKSQDVETDKLSVTKYPSVKALYDWAVGKFQLALGELNDTIYFNVNTYSELLLITPANYLIIVKVLNDENKGIQNAIYHIYPDGTRMWIAATEDN